MAASAEAIAQHFGVLALAALVLHVVGFTLGYLVPKLLRYPESVARTVSIEVGMQNGGMAASLARMHFASMPLAAAAGVFSGVMQNILAASSPRFGNGAHRSGNDETDPAKEFYETYPHSHSLPIE